MSELERIEQLKKEIYKSSPSDMISAYNREIETEKEYNGRQLLELLQNADDEQSDEVEIKLDTQSHTLTISNRGNNCTPFSYKGIRSLMISNLSSKRSTRFIGNKGLGFRSIINWGEKITINSNGLDIIFSRNIVNNIFNDLFSPEKQENIKNNSKYKNENPIPFLSIPHLIENPQEDWTTSVTIQYKSEYLEDIEKQIGELISSGIFKDYLITTDKLSQFANKNTIDFNSELFKKFDIGEYAIKDLLLNIGAVEKFEDLPIESIKEILKGLESKSPDGKQTQTIYKAIRNHKEVLNDSNIKLCAEKDGELSYYPRNEVFYINTRKLPKNILKNTAIINIPPRLGNVIKFFGIKDVKDIKIDIKSYNENERLTKEFQEFFEKVKLYILVYRFEKLKDDTTKKSELVKLKDTEIFLIKNIFNVLILTIQGFNNKNPYYKIDFREYHSDKLKSCFNDNLYDFKQILHTYCKENSKEKEFLNLIGEYEYNNIKIEENILKIDYQSKVDTFIKDTFGFDLDEELESIDLEEVYDKNKNKINFEEIEASNSYRSLLYFDDKIGLIETYIESLKPIAVEKDTEVNTHTKTKEIISSTLSTLNLLNTNSSQPTNPYKVSHSQNIRKKEIGDNAEKEVYNSLVKEFGIENVFPVSKNDDKSGYDIKYKNQAGEWKYVEVKKYSNQMFYLSKGEKEFSQKYIGNYEIFLVGDEIYKIENIDFSPSSSNFKIEVEKYKVYYEIDKAKK